MVNAIGQSALRRLALGVTLGLGLMVAGCTLTPEEEAEIIEEALMVDEDSKSVWSTVKEAYPDDYGKLIEKLRLDYSENDKTLDETRNAAQQWLIDFQGKIMPDLQRAPGDDMLKWRTADYKMKTLLEQDDVEQCASLMRGAATFIESESEDVRSAIDARTEAMIRAAAAGRDDPQQYASPPDAVFVKLEQDLRKNGLDDRLIEGLISTEGMNALSSAEQCNVGVTLSKAIEEMPRNDAVQLTAHFLNNG